MTEGLDGSSRPRSILGAVLSVVLAIIADFILVRSSGRITPWARAEAGPRDGRLIAWFTDPAHWTG